jgi:hypothetical protein
VPPLDQEPTGQREQEEVDPLVPQPARQVHCAEEAAPAGANMPDGQAVGLGTQSLILSEPTALVVPKGHAKQGSLVRPVEYVPTGHWWQLSPVTPVPNPGLHTHSADEDAVVLVGIHIPTGQLLLVA